MGTPLPAAFASHFTAKVAATCSLVSIIVFLLFASPADESALFTPVGLCVLHAFLALLLFVLEHRHAIREGAPGKHTVVSLVLLYFVNVGAATLPVVVLLYGQIVLSMLTPG
ncbi:MAG: hypothetical protein OXE47_01610 [Gammaproteobacteria bacterium]|nr:hypothetical protein [Gammaproteobacteria bacterium]